VIGSVSGSTKRLIEGDDLRTLDEVARDHVRMVLEACRGNQTNAARVLGVDRKTLARNLPRWGVVVPPRPRALEPGSLIAIEGIDGSGITTQATKLVGYLNHHGHSAMLTAEPSDGPVGALLRKLLATRTSLAHAGTMRMLSLLFAADRVDHYHRVVAPALARRTTVVSDRWYHSSLAYQRTGVEREWIIALNRHARTPDATVMLEVSPEIGQRRRDDAGRSREFFHELPVQREVVAGYRATIAELRLAGERIELVDGEREPAVVFAEILHALAIKRRRARL
jgi:dTMP kinase